MRYILWISIVLASGLYIVGPIVDPDLWWHITVGKWILAHQEVPRVDHWNQFAAGTPWVAYSWTNEILFALVDRLWSPYGLLSLKLLLGVLLAATLFATFGVLSGNWFFGGVLGMFATAACFNHFTLRPQTLVWLYFAFALLIADNLAERGLKPKSMLLLAFIMVLWANTHITTALGIFAVSAWVLGRSDYRKALLVALVCFLATLLTPYFGKEWIIFLGKTSHPFVHSAVAEFQPAHIMQYSTGFLVMVLVFLGVFLFRSSRALELPKLACAGAFILAGLAVVKFLPLAVIFLCALVALHWRREGGDPAKLGDLAEAIVRAQRGFGKIPREGLSFVFLCLAIISVFKVWQAPLGLEVVPEEALDFIQEQELPAPLLNEFGRGGYVMYRFSDERGELAENRRVSIDGRTNVTPPEVFEKYMATLRGNYHWREYIDLVGANTILWRAASPLQSILIAEGSWCIVFRSGELDDGYVVFVNRSYYESSLAELPSENCSASAQSQA